MFGATKIHRYLFQEMLAPFFVSLGVFTFVLLIARIMNLTDMVVSKGVEISIIGRMLLYAMPYFFVFTIPMATLLGVLLAFLRLSTDNEITSLKAAGVSLWQLLPPVGALAVGAWLLSSYLAIWALPWGNHNFENVFFEIARNKADLVLRERVFLDSFPGMVIYINRLPGDGQLQDVFIVDQRDPKRIYTVVAKQGQLFPVQDGRLTIRLYDGSMHTVNEGLASAQTATFATYDVSMEAGIINPAQRNSKHEKEMYLDELIAEIAKHEKGSSRYNLLEMELQKKFTLPFSCLVMALIGLPLGIHTRSGRSWGVAVALLVFLLYYMMLSSAWSFGAAGAYPPLVGMWLPNVLFGLLGIFMFRRELRESPMPFLDSLGKIPAMLARLRESRSRKHED